jgi:hypothetical protein
LDPNIDQSNRRTGTWSEDEDIKLNVAVHTHGSNIWGAIAALIPGRGEVSVVNDGTGVLDTSLTNGRTGKCSEDENIKLKDAVQTHCGKNCATIAALVSGRTKMQ